jgi:hypothetical protein
MKKSSPSTRPARPARPLASSLLAAVAGGGIIAAGTGVIAETQLYPQGTSLPY